jgi:hypothetical protein
MTNKCTNKETEKTDVRAKGRKRVHHERRAKRFSWWKQITKRWNCLLTGIVTIGVIALKEERVNEKSANPG